MDYIIANTWIKAIDIGNTEPDLVARAAFPGVRPGLAHFSMVISRPKIMERIQSDVILTRLYGLGTSVA